MAEPKPIIVAPGGGTSVRNPVGGPIAFKAEAEQTGGILDAFESLPDPGEGPPLHLHVDQDEALYVLESDFRFKVDGKISPAPAGTFVWLPRRTPHTWQNVGDSRGRLLFMFTPAGRMETFFRRLAEIGEAPGPEVLSEEFDRLGPEVGMETVGPPLAVSDPL